MIISSPRRALLALAVIPFLISVASALDGDSAFAWALQAGAPSPSRIAAAKAKPQKPAPAPKPPVADDATWQKVLETVKRDGVYKPGAGPLPSVFAIDDIAGDPKGAHEARSVAVLGMINDDEQFEAMGAIFVSKSVTVDPKNGNRTVDQWMFMTDIYGEVGEGGHVVVVQTPEGKTLSTTPDNLAPSDPKIQAQYDKMLKHWAERAPKGA